MHPIMRSDECGMASLSQVEIAGVTGLRPSKRRERCLPVAACVGNGPRVAHPQPVRRRGRIHGRRGRRACGGGASRPSDTHLAGAYRRFPNLRYRRFPNRHAGQKSGAPGERMVGGLGNPRYGRLGSLRYVFARRRGRRREPSLPPSTSGCTRCDRGPLI